MSYTKSAQKTSTSKNEDSHARNWAVVVDYVPGQGWEACIDDGNGTVGWFDDTAARLLGNVAQYLERRKGSE